MSLVSLVQQNPLRTTQVNLEVAPNAVFQNKPTPLMVASSASDASLLAVNTLSRSEPPNAAASPMKSKIEVLTKEIERYESLKKIAQIIKKVGLFIALGGTIAAVAFFGAPIVIPGLAFAAIMALALAFKRHRKFSSPSYFVGATLLGYAATGIVGVYALKPIINIIYKTPLVATIGGIACGAITGIGGLIAGAGGLAENHYAKKIDNLQSELKEEIRKTANEFLANQEEDEAEKLFLAIMDKEGLRKVADKHLENNRLGRASSLYAKIEDLQTLSTLAKRFEDKGCYSMALRCYADLIAIEFGQQHNYQEGSSSLRPSERSVFESLYQHAEMNKNHLVINYALGLAYEHGIGCDAHYDFTPNNTEALVHYTRAAAVENINGPAHKAVERMSAPLLQEV